MLQHTVHALQSELDNLRADNIKLYEKIKFLQSYPGRVSVHLSICLSVLGLGSHGGTIPMHRDCTFPMGVGANWGGERGSALSRGARKAIHDCAEGSLTPSKPESPNFLPNRAATSPSDAHWLLLQAKCGCFCLTRLPEAKLGPPAINPGSRAWKIIHPVPPVLVPELLVSSRERELLPEQPEERQKEKKPAQNHPSNARRRLGRGMSSPKSPQ